MTHAFYVILAASTGPFLAAVAFLIFVVAGIRRGDRRDLTLPPNGRIDAITRRVLGLGARNDANNGER
jgi:hypothetical protein